MKMNFNSSVWKGNKKGTEEHNSITCKFAVVNWLHCYKHTDALWVMYSFGGGEGKEEKKSRNLSYLKILLQLENISKLPYSDSACTDHLPFSVSSTFKAIIWLEN